MELSARQLVAGAAVAAAGLFSAHELLKPGSTTQTAPPERSPDPLVELVFPPVPAKPHFRSAKPADLHARGPQVAELAAEPPQYEGKRVPSSIPRSANGLLGEIDLANALAHPNVPEGAKPALGAAIELHNWMLRERSGGSLNSDAITNQLAIVSQAVRDLRLQSNTNEVLRAALGSVNLPVQESRFVRYQYNLPTLANAYFVYAATERDGSQTTEVRADARQQAETFRSAIWEAAETITSHAGGFVRAVMDYRDFESATKPP